MTQVKLTKTELRVQQLKLAQLRKYLPTLQLKKALLQIEVNQSIAEIDQVTERFEEEDAALQRIAALFSQRSSESFFASISIVEVKMSHENIAGVDIPIFEDVIFAEPTYSLFDAPIWYESAMDRVREFLVIRETKKILEIKKNALEKELREVSIRVNLFEKILIPRSLENIKRIKIFLGDQQLAAVSQAKVAKKKILSRSSEEESL